MLASLYLLSEGWATATYSPFYILTQTVIFILNSQSFLLKYLLFHLFFVFSQVFHTFHILHKCCKLNKNLPWEDRDSSESQTEPILGLKLMLIPIIAGILSALRRVIARRVSIKVVTFM